MVRLSFCSPGGGCFRIRRAGATGSIAQPDAAAPARTAPFTRRDGRPTRTDRQVGRTIPPPACSRQADCPGTGHAHWPGEGHEANGHYRNPATFAFAPVSLARPGTNCPATHWAVTVVTKPLFMRHGCGCLHARPATRCPKRGQRGSASTCRRRKGSSAPHFDQARRLPGLKSRPGRPRVSPAPPCPAPGLRRCPARRRPPAAHRRCGPPAAGWRHGRKPQSGRAPC